MMPKQTRQEIEGHLRRQVRFLRTSAERFDGRQEDEAVRLAAVIRTLVRDKGRDRSVLTQLGVKAVMWFLDTSIPPPPPESGIVHISFDAGLAAMTFDTSGPRFTAPLDRGGSFAFPPTRKDFASWW